MYLIIYCSMLTNTKQILCIVINTYKMHDYCRSGCIYCVYSRIFVNKTIFLEYLYIEPKKGFLIHFKIKKSFRYKNL